VTFLVENLKKNLIFEKILTDVEKRVYLKDWRVTNREFGMDNGWMIEKCRLEGGVSDGVDIVTIDNGALSFTLVPTRGMSVWKGEFKGLQLGWDSPIKNPVHPNYVNLEARGGLGWLYGFNEWIVRCGLESFGMPGTDAVIDDTGGRRETPLTLHGRIANIPADSLKAKIVSGSTVELGVEGTVYEQSFFGTNFKLRTLTTTTLNSNTIHVRDEIENLKSVSEEMQILYHCNYGTPLLEEGAHVLAPFKVVVPRDDRSAEEIDSFDVYGPPESGFIEQVYFCELIGDSEGHTKVALINRDETKGISISFSIKELPCFTIWKNTNSIEDGYVTGLEPGTSFTNIKTFEREHKRVVNLRPREKYRVDIEFAVHLGREEVQRVKDEIEKLKGEIEPKIYKEPKPEYSPT